MLAHTLITQQMSPAGLTTQVGFIRLAHLKCPNSGRLELGWSINLRKKFFAKLMDCRVKPGNDGEGSRFKSIYMSHITS